MNTIPGRPKLAENAHDLWCPQLSSSCYKNRATSAATKDSTKHSPRISPVHFTAMAALAAVVAIAILALATSAGAASTPAVAGTTTKSPPVIYIFGDSMSDVGNNNYLLLSLAKCNYPWYGIDYKTGYPTGRFTNGRTIGDIMGETTFSSFFSVVLSARTASDVNCAFSCQVWRPAAGAVPLPVHDRRRGPRRRQLRVRRRGTPQRNRHLLCKLELRCCLSF